PTASVPRLVITLLLSACKPTWFVPAVIAPALLTTLEPLSEITTAPPVTEAPASTLSVRLLAAPAAKPSVSTPLQVTVVPLAGASGGQWGWAAEAASKDAATSVVDASKRVRFRIMTSSPHCAVVLAPDAPQR